MIEESFEVNVLVVAGLISARNCLQTRENITRDILEGIGKVTVR